MPGILHAIEQEERLDRVSSAIGNAVGKVLKTGPVKDAASGTWLRHPLHPVLTDVALGAWTGAFFCDLFGLEHAADRLVGAGVASALPTAVTGLSDFADTWEGPQRIGLVHAATNTVAVALYGASWLARRLGMRRRGVILALLGGGVVSVGAYLGGHLVYVKGVGVDQTAFTETPKEWTAVMRAEALPHDKPMHAQIGGLDLVLVRRDGAINVLADRCTHRGGPLHEGELTDGCIRCPWHGSEFRLDDGAIHRGPATVRQPVFDARERDGQIEIRAAQG